MPWSTPVTPVSGTVITVAWAQSSVVTPLLWLRGLVGGGDPPGAGYSVESVSTTTATWAQHISKAGDTMTNDLMLNRSAIGSAATGYLVLGNNTGRYIGFDGSRHVIATPQIDIQNDLYVYRISTPTQGYVVLGNNAAHYVGFDGTSTVADGSPIRTVANTPATSLVPSGLIAAVATAAGIPSGWTRYTNADGRILIGAGTTFSQTFTENTAAGTGTWTPLSGVTIPADATNIFLAAASAANNPTGATNVSTAVHVHGVPTTTWIPPVRVVVHCIKT